MHSLVAVWSKLLTFKLINNCLPTTKRRPTLAAAGIGDRATISLLSDLRGASCVFCQHLERGYEFWEQISATPALSRIAKKVVRAAMN
jgi:hypothetical protein